MSKETPGDDPRENTDPSTFKQTDRPWKGNPEKDQVAKDRAKPNLEEWKDSGTH